MKSIKVFSLSLALFAFAASAQAQVKVSAEPWQKKSLTGIASLKYGVAYDPSGDLASVAKDALKDLPVPAKAVDLGADSKVALEDVEGRLKIYVEEKRDKGSAWVGLSLEQRSRLNRDASVAFDAVTYKIGKLCSTSATRTALKELLSEFVRDFPADAKP